MGLEEPQHRPAISDTSQVPKSLRISFCAIDLHWRLPMYSESSANLNFEQFIGISLGMQQPIKGRTFACSASRIQLATVMVASAQNKTRADLRQTNNTPLPSSPIPHCYLFAIPRRLQPTLKVEFPGFTLARGTAYSIWLVNAPKLKDQPTHFSTTPQTPKPRPSGRGDYARLRRKRRVEKAEIIAFSPHKGILGRVTGLVDGAGQRRASFYVTHVVLNSPYGLVLAVGWLSLSASDVSNSVLLLPGQYTATTDPQLVHDLLTSSHATLIPNPGFGNSSASTLPLNVAVNPGLAIYANSLYSGKAAFSSLPSVPVSNGAGTPLSAESMALSSSIWVALSFGSNGRVIVWDSVPDTAQLPLGASAPCRSLTCNPPPARHPARARVRAPHPAPAPVLPDSMALHAKPVRLVSSDQLVKHAPQAAPRVTRLRTLCPLAIVSTASATPMDRVHAILVGSRLPMERRAPNVPVDSLRLRQETAKFVRWDAQLVPTGQETVLLVARTLPRIRMMQRNVRRCPRALRASPVLLAASVTVPVVLLAPPLAVPAPARRPMTVHSAPLRTIDQ
ncbi:hypothetical protein C8R46DRAFT_1305883 [Mycena filopes]|nr:hypothetical protein C8R46DRAFT_1305883 [Mycena filopes]